MGNKLPYIFFALIVAIIGYNLFVSDKKDEVYSHTKGEYVDLDEEGKKKKPSFSETEIPFPSQGHHIYHGSKKIDEANGGAIKVMGNATDNTLLKFKDEEGNAVVSIYSEKGKEFYVVMPPGTYYLYGVSGKKWYGDEFLFGPEGHYFSDPQQSWVFSDATMYQRSSGWELDLNLRIGGNVQTSTIKPEDF